MDITINTDETLSEHELKICSIQSEWRKVSKLKKGDPPINQTGANEGIFLFFWYDIFDFKPQQEISLIGKTYNAQNNTYESSCLTVSRMEKTFYILPRRSFRDNPSRPVKLKDVYEEFKRDYAKRLGVRRFKSKVVVKRSLDKNIPFLSKYLEVTCKTGNDGVQDEEGETFGYILGTKLELIQSFLLRCNIKGPCWLEVRNFTKKKFPLTKCQMEITCESIDDIVVVNSPRPPPLFRVLIFNIKTLFNTVKSRNEICLISWIFSDNYDVETQCFDIKEHFCAVHPVFGFPEGFQEYIRSYSDTKVAICYTEKDLLGLFLETFERYQLDMVISYDLTGRDVELLFKKITTHKLKLSSLSCRCSKQFLQNKYKLDLFLGKLLFNLKLLSEDFIKCKIYSLPDLIVDVLNAPYVQLDESFIRKSFEKSKSLRQLLTLVIWETYCIFDLTLKLNLIPLTLELTRICGNYWNLTMRGNTSGLCEYLLLHAFHKENYIIPDKLPKDSSPKAFEGGLVLDPKIGLHEDFVIAMDFKSLYPSIIKEFNLCLSTSLNQDTQGVLPKVIEHLLNLRKLKKPRDADVIKWITNSLYGYLAFDKSKFYSRDIAEFIAKSGREILMRSVEIIKEEFGYEIVYGDTDSVMFKIKQDYYNEILEVATAVGNRINSEYQVIKIELAAIYKPLLIHNKKKYAGVECFKDGDGIKCTFAYKGLELVRRDFPEIVRKLQENLVKEILTHSIPPDIHLTMSCLGLIEKNRSIDKFNIHQILEDFERNIRENQSEIKQFGITKRLNNDPKKYKDKKQPHVAVALSSFGRRKNLKQNDYVTYVFCKEKEKERRACHIEEVTSDDSLDLKYYMEQQALPVTLRVLGNFGVTEMEIRECFKLKPKRNVVRTNQTSENEAVSYEIICVFCRQEYKTKLTNLDFLQGCRKCKSKLVNTSNYLTLLIRDLLIKYSNSNRTKHCFTCGKETKYVSTNYCSGKKTCSVCNISVLSKRTKSKVIKEILETIRKTLQENNLDDLVKIVQSTLDSLLFETKTCKLKNHFRSDFLKESYEICCVFCDRPYTVQTDTLDFLKPCRNCQPKKFKNICNYLKLLLRKLTLRQYETRRICVNLSCKSTSNYVNSKPTCQKCNLGQVEVVSKWMESIEALKCMLWILEKKRFCDLVKLVSDTLERLEAYYVDLNEFEQA